MNKRTFPVRSHGWKQCGDARVRTLMQETDAQRWPRKTGVLKNGGAVETLAWIPSWAHFVGISGDSEEQLRAELRQARKNVASRGNARSTQGARREGMNDWEEHGWPCGNMRRGDDSMDPSERNSSKWAGAACTRKTSPAVNFYEGTRLQSRSARMLAGLGAALPPAALMRKRLGDLRSSLCNRVIQLPIDSWGKGNVGRQRLSSHAGEEEKRARFVASGAS